MNFLVALERAAINAIAFLLIWIAVSFVFEQFDQRLPVFLGGITVFVVANYFFLPRLTYVVVKFLRKNRIPRYTHTRDALLADPVNLIFFGEERDLVEAFRKAGWIQPDPLTMKTAWKMAWAFVTNRPYPAAPFSTLFLFGRPHDYGFQETIGVSPRKRHHVRFWAVNIPPKIDVNDLDFWLNKHQVDYSRPVMWVGAGSKDIGFGLARLTYQFTHSVDKNIDAERQYILHTLESIKKIQSVSHLESDTHILGKYISDSRIAVARLVPVAPKEEEF